MKFLTKKHLSADFRIFILVLIAISIPYFMLGNVIIRSFEQTYYRAKQAEAERFSSGYINSLMFALEADKIINDLLEEKLEAVSELAALYPERHSNEQLAEIAETYGIDQIFSYNPEGVVTYSGRGNYIGWQAPEGHPVRQFMESDDRSIIGPIRPDTESGILYKYGYFKTRDGYFVQLGIAAEHIQGFLKAFDRKSLLLTMASEEDAETVCLVNESFVIFESTDDTLVGTRIADERAIESISQGKRYARSLEVDGKTLYQSYIPISYERIGAMIVTFSIDDITQFRTNLTRYGLLVMFLFYGILVSLVAVTFVKERKLKARAYLDTLTGLPNSNFLFEYIDRFIPMDTSHTSCLYLVQCQNYDELLSFHGETTINDLMISMGKTLQGMIQRDRSHHNLIFGSKLLRDMEGDMKLFKYRDNIFVIHAKDLETESAVRSLLESINELFNNGISLGEAKAIPILIRCGVIRIDGSHKDAQSLIEDATLTLQQRKGATRSDLVFTRELVERKEREAILESELLAAIEDEASTALRLAYQPQIELTTGNVIGFEALARFNSQHFGTVPPSEFIDLAERRHLIIPLGNAILHKACQFIARMESMNHRQVKVAVNISGIQLLQQDFSESVITILDRYGIDRNLLELEITETVLLEDFEQLDRNLKKLTSQGVLMALDDFGVGYSSLVRLKGMDFNILKIDRMFIKNIMVQDHKNLLTPVIIEMAHRLGMKVIAEGIEYPEQDMFLKEHSCDMGQGYLYGKPMEEDLAEALIQGAT